MDEERWTERLDGPAEVRAYGCVIRYRHLGRGRPLLLLPSPHDSWRVASELVGGLSGPFRLIVPDLGPAGADPTCGLACLLDGLGARAVGLVATDCFRASISHLVSRDPGQIGRMVVVLDEPPERPARSAASGPAPAVAEVPVLELRKTDLEVPSTLTTLIDFLGQHDARSSA